MSASIIRALNVAITGMQKNEFDLGVTAQNLSAQGVLGYKKIETASETLPAQNVDVYGTPVGTSTARVPIGLQIGMGVRVNGTYHVFTAGDFKNTNNALDMAIEGAGMFQVIMPDGTYAYTRAGSFHVDGQSGNIVTPQGYTLSPGIQIPQNAQSVGINSTGQVLVSIPGQTQPQIVGQLQLANFVNYAGLQEIGQNLFVQTDSSGTAVLSNPGTNNAGTVLAGFVEGANVDVVTEITNLIKINRGYEQLAKVLNTADSMLENGNRVGA